MQKANDVSYTIDGDPISSHSAHPTHMQTSTPGVVMNIDGDKFLIGNTPGAPAIRVTPEVSSILPWL